VKTKIVKPVEPEKEIPTEILAESILELSEGIKKVRAGRLNDRALFILLRDATGVGINEIESIVDALENLDRRYLKPKEKPRVKMSEL
jgi:hypothetical protein